jgi:hypothetical protein
MSIARLVLSLVGIVLGLRGGMILRSSARDVLRPKLDSPDSAVKMGAAIIGCGAAVFEVALYAGALYLLVSGVVLLSRGGLQ